MNLTTPVAFFVFNRPRLTQQVFSQIARARPTDLLLIADGPRFHHPTDVENCQAVRRIVDTIDWPCRVLQHYSATNLGLADRLTSGLNWVFDTVEECIILEDDCLRDLVPPPLAVRYFQKGFDAAYRGELRTWDYQWTFACLSQSALGISPRDDLIMNLGHGVDATHTKADFSPEGFP